MRRQRLRLKQTRPAHRFSSFTVSDFNCWRGGNWKGGGRGDGEDEDGNRRCSCDLQEPLPAARLHQTFMTSLCNSERSETEGNNSDQPDIILRMLSSVRHQRSQIIDNYIQHLDLFNIRKFKEASLPCWHSFLKSYNVLTKFPEIISFYLALI